MRRRFLCGILSLLPLTIFLSGCGVGAGGEGTNLHSQTGGVPIIRANSFNDKGWALFAKGQYESALGVFQKVLADAPTIEEEAEANNGIGWARSRIGMLTDGKPWFEKAAPLSDDAKVGLAAAYVQKGSKADLEVAARILYRDLGRENPNFRYVPRRPNGVTDAEVHALLAYVYAALGKHDEAIAQMDFAKERNPQWAGTTIDQLDRMVSFLLR